MLRSAFLFGAAFTLVVSGACSSDDATAVPNPSGKAGGEVCTDDKECQSLACKDGKCAAFVGGDPTNGTKDGDETDVDCGGTVAPKCAETKACKVGGDCMNAICTGSVCVAPSPTDGAKNGDETDVDCGGAKAPKCAATKGCATNADCSSGGCAYTMKCADYASCTGKAGGDSCGAGETFEADAKHESCCTTVPMKTGGAIGKYLVTSGRMRAFVTATKGDIKGWITTAKPKGWSDAWTAKLPASMAEALVELGPDHKRGCNVKERGGRTYWQPPIDGDAEEVSDWTQEVLDEKAQNCVTWYMANAICAYDGGRLPKHAEVMAQVTNNGTTDFPWGDKPVFDVKAQLDQLVHEYSYQTPNPPADLRTVGEDPVDQSLFMAPPGRRPLGANKAGVMDAMGDMMPWVSDAANDFTWTSSFEMHELQPKVSPWPPEKGQFPGEEGGYYALGIRCAFDK